MARPRAAQVVARRVLLRGVLRGMPAPILQPCRAGPGPPALVSPVALESTTRMSLGCRLHATNEHRHSHTDVI